MNLLRQLYEQNKKWLSFSLISTFLWGMAAHAYRFLNNTVSHDSLNEFHGAIWGNTHKIKLGRIFVPLYQDLARGDLSVPWLIGCLSLLWIGLSVFLVVRIFKMESRPMVFLTAGIFTTNITVSATAATYLHDLDCYAFSLLCAVAAVSLWNKKHTMWQLLIGAILIALSIGMYQSFVFVTVALVMMVCIFSLLEKESFQSVFRKGLLAVSMIVAGGLLYAVSMKLVTSLGNIQMYTNEYNTIDKMSSLSIAALPDLILGAYQDWFVRLITMPSNYPGFLVSGIVVLLFLLCIVALAYGLHIRKLPFWETLLYCLLILLLPLGMNLIYVLTMAESHDLMVYATWLFLLLALLLSRWLVQVCNAGKLVNLQHILCLILVLVLLYGNVQFSNGMYLKKDIEYDAYLSLMTRVMDRVEEHEDYIPKETPVVFVGLPRVLNKVQPGFKDYWNVTGMMKTDVIYTPSRSYYQAYMDYVLGVSVILAEEPVWSRILSLEETQQIPSYPSKDCIAMIDGTMVVKLGNFY